MYARIWEYFNLFNFKFKCDFDFCVILKVSIPFKLCKIMKLFGNMTWLLFLRRTYSYRRVFNKF